MSSLAQRGASVILAVALLCGCSVMEDRSVCPAYVLVDVDEFIYDGFRQGMISFRSGSDISRDRVELPDYEGRGFEHTMSRSRKSLVSVLSGFSSGRISGDSLIVRKGSEVDPIWNYTERFVCLGDELRVKAIPHKQFCCLSIVVRGLAPQEEYPYSFRVRAACGAMDLFSGAALQTEYLAAASEVGDGEFSLRIPRQKGSEGMLLEIFSSDGADRTSGKAVYALDLGAMFGEKGYDWSAPDLPDASVTIDRSTAEIRLELLPWSRDEYFTDVVI